MHYSQLKHMPAGLTIISKTEAKQQKYMGNIWATSINRLLIYKIILAEKAGFEPAVRYKPYTRFPGVHLRPLGHFSVNNSESVILTGCFKKVAQDKPVQV